MKGTLGLIAKTIIVFFTVVVLIWILYTLWLYEPQISRWLENGGLMGWIGR